MKSVIDISSTRIIRWMNIIRDTTGVTQYRLLENFWESQLRSKAWLINSLKTMQLSEQGDVYIFGGWCGILGSLIKDNCSYTNVYSIDVDPWCKEIGSRLDDRIIFTTADMNDFVFEKDSNVGLIINTSTEHVSQTVYDNWFSNLPTKIPIILQGNNFYSCNEHIRSTENLTDFVNSNRLDEYLFTDELDCEQFTRFMTIGYKNETTSS